MFWVEQVFASVITALAKWPVRVCAAFQIENKTRGTAGLRRVTSIGCPLLLANSGASWERAWEREGRQRENAFLLMCLFEEE